MSSCDCVMTSPLMVATTLSVGAGAGAAGCCAASGIAAANTRREAKRVMRFMPLTNASASQRIPQGVAMVECSSLWRTSDFPCRGPFGHSTRCGNVVERSADDFPLAIPDNSRTSFMSVAQLDVTLDRPLPQSPDAERAVLGAILENPNAFYRVVS